MPDRNILVKRTYALQEFGTVEAASRLHAMNHIAAIRKARGLSQAELAEMAGVEQPTISKVENGSDSVTLRTIKQIADALQVSVADLFADRTETERLIMDAYRSLPEQRRRGWQDMARAVISEVPEGREAPVPRSAAAADRS